jgi:hypothetical protein
MMADWNQYKNSDGEWAEVGAFILEASVNGSWVVRHKMGAVPCRVSADIGEAQPGGLDGAKASCERALAEVLGSCNDTAAVAEQKAITVALCKRYQQARASDFSESVQQAAFEDLDQRVNKYLEHGG